MEFRPQHIQGCLVVGREPSADERGFFARAFSADEFEKAGLVPTISQINISRSEVLGTTRGIHWQEQPYSEAKLLRCIRGRFFDVCVDVCPGSETWGGWVGIELIRDNDLALYLPPGCGHAYQTLEPETELLYSTSAAYAPEAERGARWDDPGFAIDWPQRDGLVLSVKDQSWPDFGTT